MVKQLFIYAILVAVIFLSAVALESCDLILTSPIENDQTLDGPIEGLTAEQLRIFLEGDEQFGKVFSFNEGLGPVFNNTGCATCHVADGRSDPSFNLKRFQKNLGGGNFDPMIEHGGLQLQDKCIPGYSAEVIPSEANAVSERGGPIVTGLGLIEAVPDETILKHSDPDDINGDGISGRPQYVAAPEFLYLPPGPYSGNYLGKFGRKAGSINLLQQTVGAYLQDIGITTDFLPEENYNPLVGGYEDPVSDPELSSNVVNAVTFYLKTLKPPVRRMQDDLRVIAGESKFNEIGCTKCHIPKMETGFSPVNALSYKEFHSYTDMLLHDMGPELADNFVEGVATGTEWRTTPLWGLGITHNSTGGIPFYMHDGRTSSIIEAIRLHGGEAETIKNIFMNLSEEDKQNIIAFLMSL